MAIKVRRGKLYPAVEMDYGLSLGLDEVEWERIVDRLGRLPNHFECSIFATLWSDPVSNKSSAALLNSIAREMPEVLTVPGTEVGVVKLSENLYLALRVVHNNQQSLIESYYGAQTAIDSALEELSSIGAQPLAVLNLLRFGSYDLIRNRRAFQSAVEGIGAYSSKYGLPVVGGDLYFHSRYNSSQIINAGVVGLLSNSHALEVTEVALQSPIIYVGAKTGSDGLTQFCHNPAQPEQRSSKPPTLKMSDPLLANRMISACAEAIDRGVLKEVVSVGTGGLAVASFDMACRINRPILLDIDRVPLRNQERQDFVCPEPLDIIMSETAERVLMLTDREHHRELNQILYKWDLESVKVGEVNDADGIEFYWNHYLVADIPFQFALGGHIQKSFDVVQFPPMLKRSEGNSDANEQRKRKRKIVDEWSLVREVAAAKQHEDNEKELPCPKDLEDVWLDMLANPNLCARTPMYLMFDSVVGANTLQQPGGDAAVLRLRNRSVSNSLGSNSLGQNGLGQNGHHESNDLSQLLADEQLVKAGGGNGNSLHSGSLGKKSLAVSLDSNSLYVSMDPYLGTVQTIAESMRNLAASGAKPIGLAYCLNYGDPDRYREVCDLAESIRGLGDASRIWQIPILSQQISLLNGTEGNPILPTPSILMAGILDDMNKMGTVGFKHKGDVILLLGLTKNEIGCSEYANYSHKHVNQLVPDIDFEAEKGVCDLIINLIGRDLLQSTHDLSAGGLAIALTESCMQRRRPIGAQFEIDPQVFESPNGPISLRRDAALFSESSGRFLVSCKPQDEQAVRDACAQCNVPVTGRGTVGGKAMTISGAVKVELPLSTTYKLWYHRLESLLGQGGEETLGF